MPSVVEVKTLVEYLQSFGVDDAIIPLLIMTASFESGLSNDVVGVNDNGSKDYGVYQINIDSFYTDRDENKPDNTIKTFFKNSGKKYSKSELEENINKNEKFASRFVAHYIQRLTDNPDSFKTKGDPLNRWNAYRELVVPLIKGQKIDRDTESITNAIGAYVNSYMQIKSQEFKDLFNYDPSSISTIPTPDRGNNG